MKIVIDYDDLTSMIVNDLASKGITIDASNIEFNENGVEIALDTVTKTTKPKKKEKRPEPKKPVQETVEEVIEDTDMSDDVFQDNENELVEPTVESNTDDDDSLFG